jgi:GNAT superfamily N-acetyltransferase
VIVRRAGIDEIRPLRHAELRAGLPFATAVFDGDDAADTWHLAAVEEDTVIGCASFLRHPWTDGADAYQLRGMATRRDRVGQGVGAAVLRFAEAEIPAASGLRLFWCNARVPAVGFYARCGWTVESEPFDVPTAGPHRRMLRHVPVTG